MEDASRTVRARVIALALSAGLLGSFCPHPATAHGDLAMEFDTCVLRVGPDRVHFTGYQVSSQRQEFCEDIPQPGRTIVVLDYFDPLLRGMTAEFRVIKDVGADENGNLDNVTVAYLPPSKHPTGTFNFEHDFEKGKFVGLLTVTEQTLRYKARFPFSVGLNNGKSTNLVFYGLIATLIAFVCAYWYFIVRPRRGAPAPRQVMTAEGWDDVGRS